MKILALNISLGDLLKSLSKLSRFEKKDIYAFLESELSKEVVNESVETYLLTEKTLAKDWLKKQEDEAWKDL